MKILKSTLILYFAAVDSGYEKRSKGNSEEPFADRGMHTSRARVGESKKVLHYNRCEHCVCKVAKISDTTKQRALKDAEKFALFCHPLCRYVNTFCFTGAKVTQSFEINKCIRKE